MVALPSWVSTFASEFAAEWRPPERLGGAEWAERERWLGADESKARPGRWRCFPWQVEILDAFADPSLDWIVIMKASQMGVTDMVRCAIGRWMLLDPGDVLWVTTTEDAAKKAMTRLQALFRNTPALRGLVSRRRVDSTLLEMRLTNGCRIVIGWAGSAQSLASEPFRYVALDEVAKYKRSIEGEGSPIALARERVKTFGRRGKVIVISTPKHGNDLIVTEHGRVRDRRVFAVPCDDCGHVQPLTFEATRWPGGSPASEPTDPLERGRLADEIEVAASAWVTCSSCTDGHVHPHRAMYAPTARWVKEEPAPKSSRRAYHVPEFLHWEVPFSALAVKWLRCTSPIEQQGFYNQQLGLPFKSARGAIDAALFERRAVHEDGLVPAWATAVLATADTQGDHFVFMLRAWGPGWRSRLLDWGRVETFDELRARTLEQRFDVEGLPDTVRARFLLIDSGGGMETPDGSRTNDVYQFARRTPNVLPVKGRGDLDAYDGRPIAQSIVLYRPPGSKVAPYEQTLHLLNVEYWKDTAAALIRAEPAVWQESKSAAAPEYGKQMTAEHKVMHAPENGETYWRWVKRSKHGKNDLFDCAVYQCAAAEIAGVDQGQRAIAERIEAKKKRRASPKAAAPRSRGPDGRPFHVGQRRR